ncbi:UDP-glycosyltransferase 83A1-like [Alnus glutinosa]|uniref:UDP-glycosyltransferase 83A1-like n=1 Tax=Alnus glutinosa TaxID=3517 RepID=UPI002D777ECF|nr:UDP-glycosyltransferase 83A1-like [Alnus glutinosa]
MGIGHVLVLPCPAQSAVNALMRFSREMAKHGFKITFVNTEFIHKSIVSAMPEEGMRSLMDSNINLVSIPDSLEIEGKNMGSLMEVMSRTMPGGVEELIKGINASNGDENITCIVADGVLGWAMELANKMGIRGVMYWCVAAAVFALQMSVPNLIHDGILDADGFSTKKVERIQLSPGIPAIETSNLPWAAMPMADPSKQKILFHFMTRNMEPCKLADWWLCNTAYELEPASVALFPKLLPIGPLLENDQTGQFRQEDSSCLSWLDRQAPCSVIYISFGSVANLDPVQFQELALGLKLTNRPFLWAVDQRNIDRAKNEFPDESEGACTKIVDWAPQTKVLAHPAVACFISHCGWSSITEAISNGVPFLCWPLFLDQFLDKSYICEEWKVGLGFDQAENGVVLRGEVAKKVEQLLSNESIRARALELKETMLKTTAKGGQSSKNFNNFVKWLKQ